MSSTGITGFGPTSGITFGGLASGLDTQAIITALLAIEQRPITALQNKRQSYVGQKSLFSDLEQRLQKLKDAVDDLRSAATLLEHSATSSDESVLTASATSAAKSGTYAIAVTSLAAGQVSKSGAHTSGTTQTISGGASAVLSITVGTQSPIDVDLTNELYSLQDIADAINAKNGSVTAQVLQVNANDYRLVLTGGDGTSNAFTVTGSGSAQIATLAAELNTPTTSATDAVFSINGVGVTRTSNQVSDAISGVTLNLLRAGSSTLTVVTDTTATGDKVQGFVDAYNGVLDFMQAQAALDPNTNKPTSALFGDSTLRTVRTTLRSLLGNPVPTGNAAYELLAQVGVESDRDGRLTFDRGEFDTAVTTDDAAVKALFADPTTGIAQRLYQQTDAYLDTVDGILVARQKGFDSRILDADKQIAAGQRRLAQVQQALTLKFTNLEVLMGRLQSQGASLAFPNQQSARR